MGASDTPFNDDNDECTITDLAAGQDGPGEVPVESIDEDVVEETEPEGAVLERAVKGAVNLLKEIKKLKTSEEVRAALPAAPLLGEKMVWITKRVRALAMKCGFDPPLGMTRNVLLQMIEDFRLGREGGVLGELVQVDAPPAPVALDDDECEDEVELARSRAQEEEELLRQIAESERDDEQVELARSRAQEEEELLRQIAESERDNEQAAEFAAAEKRKAVNDALSADHAAKMVSLRAQLDRSRGATASLRPLSCPTPIPLPLPRPLPRFPLLAEAKAARMDKGVARPPPRRVQPDHLATAAPPRCVELPDGMWEGCDPLEVHTRNARCFLARSRSLECFSVVSNLPGVLATCGGRKIREFA